MSQSKRSDCNVVGVTAGQYFLSGIGSNIEFLSEVKNVLNNLHISVLSQSKRGEGSCSLADVEAGTSLLSSLRLLHSDIEGVVVVVNVANDMNINVLTQSKRSSCDLVKVTAIVKDLLENLNVNVLTQSKRSTYSVSAIATSKTPVIVVAAQS